MYRRASVQAKEQDDDEGKIRNEQAEGFADAVAKLESAKKIEVEDGTEERLSSPAPSVATRSRATAASMRSKGSPPAPSGGDVTPAPRAPRVHAAPREGVAPSRAMSSMSSPTPTSPPPPAATTDAAGPSENAAAFARTHQHVRVQILVPRAKMGLLIGSQGKTIRELLQEAKALRAHVNVPTMSHSAESASVSGGAAGKKSAVVVITGPRDAVSKLKDKVTAIIAGQAGARSHDPLAYIEPYLQGQPADSRSQVPDEAKRLLQLIQKLNVAPTASQLPGAQAPDAASPVSDGASSETRDLLKEAFSMSESAEGEEDAGVACSAVAPGQRFEAPGGPTAMARPWTSDAGAALGDTPPLGTDDLTSKLVSTEAGGAGRMMRAAASPALPVAAVPASLDRAMFQEYELPSGGVVQQHSARGGLTPAPGTVAAMSSSALRQKLDYVTQELEIMTRALGRLAINLPDNLEPFPSEVDASLFLGTVRANRTPRSCPPLVITERGAGAPLIIHSQRCLQHRVDKGGQEHHGRLLALVGPSGVLTQVISCVCVCVCV